MAAVVGAGAAGPANVVDEKKQALAKFTWRLRMPSALKARKLGKHAKTFVYKCEAKKTIRKLDGKKVRTVYIAVN